MISYAFLLILSNMIYEIFWNDSHLGDEWFERNSILQCGLSPEVFFRTMYGIVREHTKGLTAIVMR